jgi:hypothetical protein
VAFLPPLLKVKTNQTLDRKTASLIKDVGQNKEQINSELVQNINYMTIGND